MLFAAVVILLSPSVTPAQQAAAPKRILVLNWYGRDWPNNEVNEQNIQAVFQSAPAGNIEYYPEYLEADRFPGDDQAVALRDYLRQKYARRPIDVLVAIADPPLRFLLKYRDDLFPNAPIVFASFKHPTGEELTAGPGLTGVVQTFSYKQTLDLALRLHPGTEQVFIVSGTLDHDKTYEEMGREKLQGYENRVAITYLTDLSPKELIDKTKSLPNRSIVIYVWQQVYDEQGKVLETRDVLSLIAASAPVPIYGMASWQVGSGIVGGYVRINSGVVTKVAEIALQIANGERAQNIPVETMTVVPIFDWRELKRWGIREDLLPPGSIVSFKEPTFWEQYWRRIIGTLILIGVQTLLITFLLLERAKRQRATQRLRESERALLKDEAYLREAQTLARLGNFHWNLSTDTLSWSDELYRIYGLPPGDPPLTGEAYLELVHLDHREQVRKAIEHALSRQQPFEHEYRIIRAGEERWVFARGEPVVDAEERVIALQGICQDITERKRAEEALRKSEAQLTAEAAALARLNDASSRLWHMTGLREGLDEMLAATIELLGAVLGIIQVLDAERGVLIIAAQRGFEPDFLDFFREVSAESDSACGRAWRACKRIIIEDVEADETFAPFRPIAHAAGFRAVQSTPLIGRDGALLGMLSTYFRSPHQPSEQGLRRLDLYATQAADFIERYKVEEELKASLLKIEQLTEQLQAENTYLQEEIKLEHHFDEIIGNSNALKYVLFRIEQVAPTDTTVLLLGETGTGKELAARAIHNLSLRKGRPFIKVNCAALSPTLIESELFGHEKGAFTGAQTRKVGRFEVAGGGTIFLDEIGELPLELQPKLLRVLQEGEFERLGGSQTIKADVRVIAATNRNLNTEVEKGLFREDLWYRLNVFPATLPPLRQRLEDLPLLIRFFTDKFSQKLGKRIESVAPTTIQALEIYSWPGNVRELANVIERAVIITQGPVLALAEKLESAQEPVPPSRDIRRLEEMERDFILQRLEEVHWIIEGPHGVAQSLGVNPSTLRHRMKKLGISKITLHQLASRRGKT